MNFKIKEFRNYPTKSKKLNNKQFRIPKYSLTKLQTFALKNMAEKARHICPKIRRNPFLIKREKAINRTLISKMKTSNGGMQA